MQMIGYHPMITHNHNTTSLPRLGLINLYMSYIRLLLTVNKSTGFYIVIRAMKVNEQNMALSIIRDCIIPQASA